MPTYTSSTPLVLEVDDAAVEVLEGGLPKITIGDTAGAQAAAEAAQATADAALPASGNLAGVASPDLSRVSLNAARRVRPWGVAGYFGRLTHQPLVQGTLATSTAEPGRVVYFPCCPEVDIPVVQWVVEVTNTPVGTGIVCTFARYAMAADGTPGARVADYTSSGGITIPNSPAALVASSTFAQVVIPAGEWHLAVLFLGAAGGTPPVLRTVTGHPSIGASTMTSLNTNGGYRSPDTSNVAFPLNATIGADQGRGGVLLYGKHA
jgi:hypothetical protein